MTSLRAVVPLVLLVCACGATPAPSAPAPDVPAAREKPPRGFVEGSFGATRRDATGQGESVIFIRGAEPGGAPIPVDAITIEFFERFAKDRSAAIEWAKTEPELAPAIALASKLESAHYQLVDGSFVFLLFGEEDMLESDRPHVVIAASGAPFFIQSEALEGFAYEAAP